MFFTIFTFLKKSHHFLPNCKVSQSFPIVHNAFTMVSKTKLFFVITILFYLLTIGGSVWPTPGPPIDRDPLDGEAPFVPPENESWRQSSLDIDIRCPSRSFMLKHQDSKGQSGSDAIAYTRANRDLKTITSNHVLMANYDLEYDVTPNGNCRNSIPVQMFHVKIKKSGDMTYINMGLCKISHDPRTGHILAGSSTCKTAERWKELENKNKPVSKSEL